MMIKLNKSGFVHLEFIVVLIVITVVAVVGVRLLNGSKAATLDQNGTIYSARKLLSRELVPTGVDLGNFPATCAYGYESLNDVSPDGVTMASVCDIPGANGMSTPGLSTFAMATGANFKVLANMGDNRRPLGNGVAWQKAKVGGKSLQILTTRFDASKNFWLFTRYDSVTGTQTLVKANGTLNLIGSNPVMNTPYYDWSLDGKRILYVAVNSSNAATGKISIKKCTINLGISPAKRTCGTAKTIAGNEFVGLRWSQDMTKIAYTVKTSATGTQPGTTKLYIANADLTGIKTLLQTGPNNTYSMPVWSPDGTLVAWKDGQNLQTVEVATGAVKNQFFDESNYLYQSPSAWAKVVQ